MFTASSRSATRFQMNLHSCHMRLPSDIDHARGTKSFECVFEVFNYKTACSCQNLNAKITPPLTTSNYTNFHQKNNHIYYVRKLISHAICHVSNQSCFSCPLPCQFLFLLSTIIHAYGAKLAVIISVRQHSSQLLHAQFIKQH